MNKSKAPAVKQSSHATPSSKPKALAVHKGKASMEVLLGRVESVRLAQRQQGHFDCFAKAKGGYCDQSACLYHAECLSLSSRLG